MKRTDAVIVAVAGKVDGKLSDLAPDGRKSLIEIGGRPAVSHLIENLKACPLISKVIVVSDEPGFVVAGADLCVDATGEPSDCVLAGVRAVEAERCLIMNGDMPLASTQALTDLLTCSPDCDLVYPIVGKSDVQGVFPERKAFYVETKEGHFTGSTCLLFDPKAAMSREAMLTRLLSAKSNPMELLSIVGPGLAMKLMLSKLALREFEEHISRALKMSCRVFITHFPEMLFSIDTHGDVGVIERGLSGLG